MAEEIKKVVSVDVSKTVEDMKSLSDELEEMDGDILDNIKTFKDYKTVIERLSVSISKMDEGTDEYEKTLTDLNKVQNAYNDALSVSKKKTDDAAGSYNALSKEMSELKKAFKATNDESERQKIGEKIVGINDRLKKMDASIGNYQRNVGNYSSAFTDGLSKIGEKFAALNNPVGLAKKAVLALSGAFKTLLANPIGAIIAAVVVTVKALVAAFKSNEEASNKLKKAFSAFEPVANLVKNALGKVVNIIGDALIAVSKLAEGIRSAGVKVVELLNKIGLVSDEKLKSIKDNIAAQKDALSESRKLSEEEIALEERKRDEMVKTAEKNAEISELKAKAAETDKYTNAERNKFLKRAVQLEKEINEERLAIAKQELDIAERRAAQNPNSKEDNDRLAEIRTNYFNVKREYTDKIKELNGQIASSSKAVTESVREETDVLTLATKALEDGLKDIDKAITEQDRASEKEREDREKRRKEISRKVQDRDNDPQQLELQKLKEKYETEYELLDGFQYDQLHLTEQYEADKAAIIDRYRQEKEQKDQDARDKENAAKIAEIEELAEKREEYSKMANDISDLLGSIGDGWNSLLEQQYKTGKLSEKEYKRRQKALQAFQIASIVGQSAASIFDLWSGYAKETAIINTEGAAPAMAAAPIVKAALDAKSLVSTIAKTATIATTAATQIASIKSGNLSSANSSSGISGIGGSAASVSGAAAGYVPSYSQSVMGKTDIEELQNAVSSGTSEGQKNVRVWVLAQDIMEKENEIKVSVNESTF